MKHIILISAIALALTGCNKSPTNSGARSGAQNRVISIGNYTGVTMTQFQATSTSGSRNAISGNDELKSGLSFEIDMNDRSGACVFNLKAVLADGKTITRNNFDACTEASWAIS